MELLTQELRAKLPKLYAHEDTPPSQVPVVVKFFTPDGAWTWYATEFDGVDTFFGFVSGHERELGYFSLAELRAARGPMGLPIERDLHYRGTLADALKAHGEASLAARLEARRAG